MERVFSKKCNKRRGEISCFFWLQGQDPYRFGDAGCLFSCRCWSPCSLRFGCVTRKKGVGDKRGGSEDEERGKERREGREGMKKNEKERDDGPKGRSKKKSERRGTIGPLIE